MDANIEQAANQSRIDGAESMDPALKTLKAALEGIRDRAATALKQIEQPHEQHSTSWKCKDCRYKWRGGSPKFPEQLG